MHFPFTDLKKIIKISDHNSPLSHVLDAYSTGDDRNIVEVHVAGRQVMGNSEPYMNGVNGASNHH